MKPCLYPATLLTVFAVACLAPALAFGGPDDTPRPRQNATEGHPLRYAPPPVTEQKTTVTATTTQTHEEIIQPLRQREESVNYRFAYRALASLGLAGSEADDQPIGYQQIYGPAPMRLYHRLPPLPPRRFRHLAEPSNDPSARPSPTSDAKPLPSPMPDPAPEVAPVGSPAPAGSPVEPAIPGDLPEAGILPDPAQEAARSRNDEILSYFQRPNTARSTPLPSSALGSPGYGTVPTQNGTDPAYLQAPEQMPIPPSRATYRVVPK